MDKEKKLQDEAINISHKQLSFFTPRHGYEPDSNIIQCMMNFAKSDIVKEYHNTDKKFTLDDMKKACAVGIDIVNKEGANDFKPFEDLIISLSKKY